MKRSSTILGILAAALLLAVASYAGIKPSANATRQEVESDTTLAVKGVLDIESGGSLKFNGTAFSASDYVPVTKAGQQTVTATGPGNDITFTAPDTIVFAIASFRPLELSSDADIFSLKRTGEADTEVDIVAEYAGDPHDKATVGAYSEEDGAVAYLSAAGVAEIQADQASGMVRVTNGGFRVYADTAPPYACDAAHEGVEYFDTDIKKKCICNGTAYVLANDDTTTTGCS